MKGQRLSTLDIVAMKRRGERIASLTAYDYTSAQMIDAAGVPFILVGDTLGMVVQGQDTTLPVTLDQIIYHSQMVARGSQRALLVGDMPFMTYQVSVEDALRNSARLITEGRVGAVKIEGGVAMAPTIERLVRAGVPVCGHLGFTPQSTHAMGGPRIQGREPSAAASLVADAKRSKLPAPLRSCWSWCPPRCRRRFRSECRFPPSASAPGPHCDGEIQVFHDVFGLYTDFQPRHTRRYLNVAQDVAAATRQFVRDVTEGTFPGAEQTSDLGPEAREHFRTLLTA